MRKSVMLTAGILTLLSLATPTMAAEDGVDARTGNNSITINSVNGIPLENENFLTYRLMDATKISDKEEKYTIVPEWQKFFNKEVKGNENTECTSDEAHEYLLKLQLDPKKFKEFKEHAYAYAKDKHIEDLGKDSKTEDKYTISNLPNGYYIIIESENKDTLAVSKDMLVTVDTANPKVSIDLKADVPSLVKTIVENGQDKKVGSYAVGDDVDFKLVSKVPDISGYIGSKTALQKDSGRYVFEVFEKMSKGLTLDPSSVKIKIGDKDYTNFKVVEKDDPDTPEKEWRIVFGTTTVTNEGTGKPDDVLSDADGVVNDPDFGPSNVGKPIVITYKAKLNENAFLGEQGNPNIANVLYSSNPYKPNNTKHTIDSTATPYTFGLDVTKENSNKEKLKDATFTLKTKEGTQLYVKPVKESEKDKEGYYIVCKEKDSGATASVKTNSDGKLVIAGLDAGDYQLVETKAPNGYQLLPAPIEFSIEPQYALINKTIDAKLEDLKSNNTKFTANKSTGYVATTVVNKAGGLLPKTGGRGIVVLVVVGMGLIITATYLMFGRRKKS